MQDEPSARQLVEAVQSFLQTVAMPNLEGHAAFHARVAANALGIVARELDIAPRAEPGERKRLAALTGLDEGANLEDMNRALCDIIRERRVSLDDPALIDHLRKSTLTKLAIDQPQYSGYKTAQATWAKDLSKDEPGSAD